MIIIAFVCLLPLLFPFYYWLANKGGDPRPLVISAAAGVIISTGIIFLSFAAKTWDTEIWNGSVMKKYSERVSCEHSYQICTQDASGNQFCVVHYEHSYDIDWVLKTDIGENIIIDRIDRRGTREPPRFSRAQIGDPVAIPKSFTNYVKGSPDSLFNTSGSDLSVFKDIIPKYPDHIYNYHYLNRVLPMKVPLPNLEVWNSKVSMLLRELGPKKQANVVIVMVNSPSQMYANALETAWLGGKKNDIIVVIGTPEYPKIAWADVISWTDQEIFKITLRDHLISHGDLSDIDAVLKIVKEDTERLFKRRSFEKDFEYLESGIEVSGWVIFLSILLGFCGSIGVILVYNRTHHHRTFNLSRSRGFK